MHLHDESVREYNQEQWHPVDEDRVHQNVRTANKIFGQVISATSCHISFWHITIPAKQGKGSPQQTRKPNK